MNATQFTYCSAVIKLIKFRQRFDPSEIETYNETITKKTTGFQPRPIAYDNDENNRLDSELQKLQLFEALLKEQCIINNELEQQCRSNYNRNLDFLRYYSKGIFVAKLESKTSSQWYKYQVAEILCKILVTFGLIQIHLIKIDKKKLYNKLQNILGI